MIKSMTGFGKGKAESSDGAWLTVEVCTVNNKGLDFRISFPSELQPLENHMKQLLRQQLTRGSVQVSVACDISVEQRATRVELDEKMLTDLLEDLKRVTNKYAFVREEVSVESLLAIPGMVSVQHNHAAEELLKELVETAFAQAMEALQTSRITEGKALAVELIERCKAMDEIITQIEGMEADVVAAYRDRLYERVEMLGVDLQMDDDRLAKEVAFFAQKSDITEELVRLRAHLKQFCVNVESEEDGEGKALTFISQELHREINTLSSKAHDTTISALALELKRYQDKLREQVLNVE